MKKKNQEKTYKIDNWSEYNKNLKNRGSLTLWISDDVAETWYATQQKIKKGYPFKYSSEAIQLCLMIKKVFHQKYRQTTGLIASVFQIMKVLLDVPDYTTLSRRAGTLKVNIPKKEKDNVVIIIDSTGLKVYGEGEWKVRQHGYSKRRTWKKLHIGVDIDGEIRVAEVTENDVADGDVVANGILDQEKAKIDAFAGDGAYDKKKVYDVCIEKKINEILIPPQKNAKIWKHGNLKDPPYPRDENLRAIRKSTRKKWKEPSGYHTRSLSETAMYRLKTIFGEKIDSRKAENQKTEALIMCAALNVMTHNGMPKGRWSKK